MQPVEVRHTVARPRPVRHFTPEAHWLNDPNGLIVVDGSFHLFFQHNPIAPRWGNIHWGHARSPDLLHWEHLPVAISPDEHGLAFSGSVVNDTDNTAGFGAGALIAVYTQDLEHLERQSLAYSIDDGMTWTRYAHNPVLCAPSGEPDFRDPKVLRYTDGTEAWWVMVVALGGEIALYRSEDLKHWEATSRLSAPWPWPNSITEVPDLVRVPVEGTQEWIWTLIVSLIPDAAARRARVRYLPVDFDGITIRPWHPDSAPEPVDIGPGLYAPMAWDCAPDQPVLIGWFDETGLDGDPIELVGPDPTALDPTEPTWCGRMSLPRRLSYSGPNDEGSIDPTSQQTRPMLRQEPIAGPFQPPISVSLTPAAGVASMGRHETNTVVDAPCFRIDVVGEFHTATRLRVRLAGKRSHLDIDVSAEGFSLLATGLVGDEPIDADTDVAPTVVSMVGAQRTMTAIIDAGSVEVFLDGGRAVWSAVCDLGLDPTSLTVDLATATAQDAAPLTPPSVTWAAAANPV